MGHDAARDEHHPARDKHHALLRFSPARKDAVGDESRPCRWLNVSPVRLYIGADCLDQGNVERAMAHRLAVVTEHYPGVGIALDDEALAGRRKTDPLSARRPFAFLHGSLIDRSIKDETPAEIVSRRRAHEDVDRLVITELDSRPSREANKRLGCVEFKAA